MELRHLDGRDLQPEIAQAKGSGTVRDLMGLLSAEGMS